MKFFLLFLLFFCQLNFTNSALSQNPDNQNFNLDIFKILPEIKLNFTNPQVVGAHNLKILGLKIYNIALINETGKFSYQHKFAILIKYQRNFSKEKLVERSLQEMSRIYDINDKNTLDLYKNKLNEIFRDIKNGDRKTAFFDINNGLKFYFNGIFVGEIKDKIFAKRFVDIWLSSKSSFAKMTSDITGRGSEIE